MTIRSDITVNWDVSPRVITVASGSSEITIQDLHDTCRYLESQQNAVDNDYLIDSAGKEFLGGTTYVGLTATLNNAVLAFEARPGPEWVLCQILGGNLVAIDNAEPPNNIDPRKPTAYTSVDRTASASATLTEQAALQYSSFGGGVTVDITSSYTGTEYPVGTPQAPVNNLVDAKTIAVERGFTKIFITGDITVDGGNSFVAHEFIGESQTKSFITITSAADVTRCEFYDACVDGTLDGDSRLKDCMITTLNYINGFVEDCVLASGTITLGGNKQATFLDCSSGVVGTSTPTIDMAGSGQSLGIRNYNGGVKLINKTGPESVSIDLNSGHLKLDSTVTDGTIVVRGVGHLTNDSTGSTIVVSTGLINPQNVASAVWDENMSSHTVSGTVGEALSDTVNNARLIPGAL